MLAGVACSLTFGPGSVCGVRIAPAPQNPPELGARCGITMTLPAGPGCTRLYTPQPPPTTTNTIAAAAAARIQWFSITALARNPAGHARTRPLRGSSAERLVHTLFQSGRRGQTGDQPQRLFSRNSRVRFIAL